MNVSETCIIATELLYDLSIMMTKNARDDVSPLFRNCSGSQANFFSY